MLKIKTHVESLSPAAKASFWFVVANVVLKGISFITTPIFTRLLNVSDYGITSIFVTWEGVISIFATLVLAGGVYNVAMTKYEQDIDRFTSCMLGLTALCSISVYTVCIIFNSIFPQILELKTEYLFFMWLQTFTNACAAFWLMQKRFKYLYKGVIAYTFANAFGGPLIAIAAIWLFPENKAYAKIVGAGVLAIIIGLIFFFYLLKKGKTLYDREYWKFALKFNVPLLPHYLAGTLLGASDKLLINSFIGSAAVGIYSISQSISGTVGLITMSINMSLIPYTLQAMKKQDYGSLRKTTMLCLILVACFCAGVALFSREAILIFATAEYLDAVVFVAPLSFAAVVGFLYGVIGNIVFYHEKTGAMSIVTLIATAVNVGLNFICIRHFGALAAAYVSLVSNIVTLAGCYYLASRYERSLKFIVDLKNMLLVFMLYSGIVIFSLVFVNMLWIRLLFVFIMLMILLLFRGKVMTILRSMKGNKVCATE